jgi:hypothetical protein
MDNNIFKFIIFLLIFLFILYLISDRENFADTDVILNSQTQPSDDILSSSSLQLDPSDQSQQNESSNSSLQFYSYEQLQQPPPTNSLQLYSYEQLQQPPPTNSLQLDSYDQSQQNPQLDSYDQSQQNPQLDSYDQSQQNPQLDSYDQSQQNPQLYSYVQLQQNPQLDSYDQSQQNQSSQPFNSGQSEQTTYPSTLSILDALDQSILKASVQSALDNVSIQPTYSSTQPLHSLNGLEQQLQPDVSHPVNDFEANILNKINNLQLQLNQITLQKSSAESLVAVTQKKVNDIQALLDSANAKYFIQNTNASNEIIDLNSEILNDKQIASNEAYNNYLLMIDQVKTLNAKASTDAYLNAKVCTVYKNQVNALIKILKANRISINLNRANKSQKGKKKLLAN